MRRSLDLEYPINQTNRFVEGASSKGMRYQSTCKETLQTVMSISKSGKFVMVYHRLCLHHKYLFMIGNQTFIRCRELSEEGLELYICGCVSSLQMWKQ